MIYLTDGIALTADRDQYVVGTPKERLVEGNKTIMMKNPRYFSNLSNALDEAVSQAVRLKIEDESITTLRDVVSEQKRLQEHFAEQIKHLR